MYRQVPRAQPETLQNNRWNTNGDRAGPDVGPRRSAPVEPPFRTQRRGRWYEGRQEIRGFKAPLCFVRPADGKRSGAKGRFLDAITGEGPDVFVIKCGDKRTLMRDRPQRWQWSGWELDPEQIADIAWFDKDYRRKELREVRSWLPSTERSRAVKYRYNFQTRRYETNREAYNKPAEYAWIDARWPDNARRREAYPLSYRDGNGDWWTRVPPNAGEFPGGRPRNFRPAGPNAA